MDKTKKHIVLLFFLALFALLSSCIFAVLSGAYQIPPSRLFYILIGKGTSAENLAVLDIRLPRMMIALMVGFALAISGNVLQTVTKNPLAEPGMIGINAGAALAVVVFITFRKTAYYDALCSNSVILMPVVAMMGGICASLLVYFLSYKKQMKPVRFILVGIGVNAGINAVISYYQLTSSQGDFHQVLVWTNGSLWGSNWLTVKVVGCFIMLLLLFVFYKRRVLDAFQLGEELATGLGIPVLKETRRLFFAGAILASLATSVAGNISFLGLLGPQIAKSLVGGRQKFILPLSGILSAILLILGDTLSRTLFSPIEIPVGIVVSIIGVPYFVYLMLKER